MRAVAIVLTMSLLIAPARPAFAGRNCRVYVDLAERADEAGFAKAARGKCRGYCDEDDAEELFRAFKRTRDSRQDGLRGTDALRRHNDEAVSVMKDLRFTKDQQRRLHDQITKQGLNRREILELAQDLVN